MTMSRWKNNPRSMPGRLGTKTQGWTKLFNKRGRGNRDDTTPMAETISGVDIVDTGILETSRINQNTGERFKIRTLTLRVLD